MNKQIEHSFTYHAPTPNQIPRYEMLRKQAKEFAHSIDTLVPNGREKSLAITKLEEVVMWANKGIACAVEPQPTEKHLPDLTFTKCGRVIIVDKIDKQFDVACVIKGDEYKEDTNLLIVSEKGTRVEMPIKELLNLGNGTFIVIRMAKGDVVERIGIDTDNTRKSVLEKIIEDIFRDTKSKKGGKTE